MSHHALENKHFFYRFEHHCSLKHWTAALKERFERETHQMKLWKANTEKGLIHLVTIRLALHFYTALKGILITKGGMFLRDLQTVDGLLPSMKATAKEAVASLPGLAFMLWKTSCSDRVWLCQLHARLLKHVTNFKTMLNGRLSVLTPDVAERKNLSKKLWYNAKHCTLPATPTGLLNCIIEQQELELV
jgi:hypothetical protein